MDPGLTLILDFHEASGLNCRPPCGLISFLVPFPPPSLGLFTFFFCVWLILGLAFLLAAWLALLFGNVLVALRETQPKARPPVSWSKFQVFSSFLVIFCPVCSPWQFPGAAASFLLPIFFTHLFFYPPFDVFLGPFSPFSAAGSGCV